MWAPNFPCISGAKSFGFVLGHYAYCKYKYHHGLYDSAEREYCGFRMVKVVQAERFLPPTQTSFLNEASLESLAMPTTKAMK
jgi:hypothetical protein